MVVIHSYKNGYGGLGDVIRSMFAYFVYFKINNIEHYYLDFSETDLKHCFDNTVPLNYKKIRNTRMFIHIGSSSTQEHKKALELLKSEGSLTNKLFIIYSNIFDFIDVKELRKHTVDFMNFLQFSMAVKNRAAEILDLSSIMECGSGSGSRSNFAAIHVRCGDAFMEKTNIQSDSRITPNSAVNKIEYIIKFLKETKDYSELPIVLFTDNTSLKNKCGILGITSLSTKVHHTSLATSNPKELEGLVDSAAEFLLLTKSKCVVSIKDSGFSYWSSFLGSVPLYKLNDENEVVVFDKLKY